MVDLTDYNMTIAMTGIYTGLDALRMPFPPGPHPPAAEVGKGLAHSSHSELGKLRNKCCVWRSHSWICS